jgi:methionyl-tRNA formyltransferase
MYRGAAPINWAIVNGETTTGVTTMRIDAGMDTGDMLLQREVEIGPSETAPELAARLSEFGAPLMSRTLRGLAEGSIAARPQSNADASVAPLLKREDGRINWSLSAEQIFHRIRGFAPWPGAFTTFRGQTCHIWGEPIPNSSAEAGPPPNTNAIPGSILANQDKLFVHCGSATHLSVTAVKLEGRKQVSTSEFLNGARLRAGEHFGET